jgi:hypothetical protein
MDIYEEKETFYTKDVLNLIQNDNYYIPQVGAKFSVKSKYFAFFVTIHKSFIDNNMKRINQLNEVGFNFRLDKFHNFTKEGSGVIADIVNTLPMQ